MTTKGQFTVREGDSKRVVWLACWSDGYQKEIAEHLLKLPFIVHAEDKATYEAGFDASPEARWLGVSAMYHVMRGVAGRRGQYADRADFDDANKSHWWRALHVDDLTLPARFVAARRDWLVVLPEAGDRPYGDDGPDAEVTTWDQEGYDINFTFLGANEAEAAGELNAHTGGLVGRLNATLRDEDAKITPLTFAGNLLTGYRVPYAGILLDLLYQDIEADRKAGHAVQPREKK